MDKVFNYQELLSQPVDIIEKQTTRKQLEDIWKEVYEFSVPAYRNRKRDIISALQSRLSTLQRADAFKRA